MLDILYISVFVLYISGNYRYYMIENVFFFKLGVISGIIIYIFLCNIGYNVRFCNICIYINCEKKWYVCYF